MKLLVGLLALSLHAASFGFIQVASITGNVSSLAYNSDVASGRLLIAARTTYSGSFAETPPTDTQGNTWITVTNQFNTLPNAAIWVTTAGSTGPNTVTWSTPGGTTGQFFVAEYSTPASYSISSMWTGQYGIGITSVSLVHPFQSADGLIFSVVAAGDSPNTWSGTNLTVRAQNTVASQSTAACGDIIGTITLGTSYGFTSSRSESPAIASALFASITAGSASPPRSGFIR